MVFGAHYDSARSAPGANDDGTGVVAVLATARELVREKARARDLIFVLFDEEERGLQGSRAFAEMLKSQNRAIHSVHTIDQTGWDENANRAIELELPYDGAVDLYTQAAAALGMSMIGVPAIAHIPSMTTFIPYELMFNHVQGDRHHRRVPAQGHDAVHSQGGRHVRHDQLPVPGGNDKADDPGDGDVDT